MHTQSLICNEEIQKKPQLLAEPGSCYFQTYQWHKKAYLRFQASSFLKISKHSTLKSLMNRKYRLSTSSISSSDFCKADAQML